MLLNPSIKDSIMISILLPAYNEEKHIEENTLKIMKAMNKIVKKYEIVVVEESTDKTPDILSRMTKRYKILRHFHFHERLGKGGAIEKGLALCKGDKVIFMDVDLATDLSSLKTMVENLEENDIVVGSRYHRNSKINRTLLRVLLGYSYSILLRIFLRSSIRDYQCGFKGLKKSVGLNIVKHIKAKNTFWDTEFLFLGNKMGYKIKEMPVTWVEHKGNSVKINLRLILRFGLLLTKLSVRNFMRKYDYVKVV